MPMTFDEERNVMSGTADACTNVDEVRWTDSTSIANSILMKSAQVDRDDAVRASESVLLRLCPTDQGNEGLIRFLKISGGSVSVIALGVR